MLASVVGAMLVGLVAMPGGASAQLPHPRCGGWPPTPGTPGVLVGGSGVPCYGQILGRISNRAMILDVQVLQPLSRGSFRMIGLREFQYTPSAGLKDWDRIVLLAKLNVGGQVRERRIPFRATTDDFFLASGGSENRPPPGIVAGRRSHGKRRGAGN